MTANRDELLAELEHIVSTARNRTAALKSVADILKRIGDYRWVGLYEVDRAAGVLRNVVWSGPGPPEHPVFPATKGLTGAAIASRKTVNVGDVGSDPRYLTAFGSTKSEMIVPVFDVATGDVVGTIDVESKSPDAFNTDMQTLLEACSKVIQPLWNTAL